MRSDDKLSEEVRKSEDWTSDPVSGRANTEVVRFSAPDEERVRMSLSGKERNYLFLNDAAGSFLDVSGVSGTDSEKDGRSFAILDMDRDGWQDMVLANANTPVLQMFRNQLGDSSGNGGNIIAVRFVGGNRTASPSESMSNRDGVGVKVKVDLGGGSLLRESFAGEGLAAQNSGTMMIGIGEREGVELLEIIWPSGKVQRIAEAKAGELITVHEDVAEADGETGVVRERYLPEGGKSRAFDDQETTLGEVSWQRAEAEVVVYVSMASWCQVCRNHLPDLKRLRERMGGENLKIVAVPHDSTDTIEDITTFAGDAIATIEMWDRDDREAFRKMGRQVLGSEVLPTVMITKGDQVVEVITAVPTVSDLNGLLGE